MDMLSAFGLPSKLTSSPVVLGNLKVKKISVLTLRMSLPRQWL